ncbi:MAG TPA: hypothetical protein VF042_15750 [Gemmatimonadaceae bacterium]
MKRLVVWIASLAVLAGCDSTRPNGPGTVTAALVSPNGAEGAAILDVTGTVESFKPSNNVSMYTTPSAAGTRVILVSLTPGDLSVKLSLADVSATPQVSVVEVADGDDKVRPSLTGYRVEFR